MSDHRKIFSTPTRLAVATLGALASVVHAAPPVADAGTILRQTEQNLQLDKPPAAVKRRSKPPVPTRKPDEATVKVTRFAFAGNRLLSDAVLRDALGAYLDRPLTFQDLQAAAALVTQTYRDAGWLVTTSLPRQDISDGVVTLRVTEAVMGQVSVSGPAPQRVSAKRLVRMFESQQAQGQPVHIGRVDRALLLLDDLPGVMVTGNLQAGGSANETDMSLSAVDESLFQGEVSSDNHGAVATGVYRASFNAVLNSPLGVGDQVQLNSMRSEGSEYLRLAYSVPMGNDGWRAQVRTTRMKHQLIGDLAATGVQGEARTQGAEISYPLVRSQTSNLNLSLGYDIRQYENFDNTGLTSRYETRASSLGVLGNAIDATGATNSYGLTWVKGTVDLSEAPSAYATSIQNGPNTAGRYERLSLNLNRLQPVAAGTSLWLAYSAQTANRNLDSSEKIYLEGPTSVRAYGAGATGLGGSEGQIFSAELRHTLSAQWRVTGFYDHGVATVNRNNQKADGTGLLSAVNHYQLRAYGLSLAWQGHKGLQLRATVSQRVGQNPNARSLDPRMDQDGTYRNPRYWLSASYPL